MTILSRRSLIAGLVSLVAAPAIVRASNIMPVKAWEDQVRYKAYERFLIGQHGTVYVDSLNPNVTDLIACGASEHIHPGDILVMDNGYVRRMSVADLRNGCSVAFGVARTGTQFPYPNQVENWLTRPASAGPHPYHILLATPPKP